MSNYYDKKFYISINDLEYTTADALSEIVHTYLDDKPKKLKNKNVTQCDRNELFWNSKLLQDNRDDFLKLDTYSLVLSKNFKSKSIYQIGMIKEHAILSPFSVQQALKYSQIFLKNENSNYAQLKTILPDGTVWEEFIKICDSIAQHYQIFKKDVKNQENILMGYGYVDLLFLMSLSSLKYASKNLKVPSNITIYSMTLTKILQDRLKKKDKRKRAIEQTHIDKKTIKYFMQNVHKNEVPVEYIVFEEIYRAYESLILFEQNELYTFLYDENYQSILVQNEVSLCPIDIEKHINTEMHSEKLQGMFKYYEEEVMIILSDKLSKEYNDDMNFFQEKGVYQVQLIDIM